MYKYLEFQEKSSRPTAAAIFYGEGGAAGHKGAYGRRVTYHIKAAAYLILE